MSNLQKDMIDYFVICVNEFANRHKITSKESFEYLYTYKGMAFLNEFYDVQHTHSFDDTVDDLTQVCINNGGTIN